MEWLLFFNNENTANTIKTLLDSLGATSVVFPAECDNVARASYFFKSANAVVIEKGFFASTPGLTSFLAGFVAGKDVSAIIIDSKKEGEFYSLLKECKKKDSLIELSGDFSKKFSIIAKDLTGLFEKNTAYCALLSSGKPFTADCFCSYIKKEDLDTCTLYTKAGFDVNTKTSLGTPPLCEAVRAESKKMVDFLLECGADINALSQDRGFSPVMDAVWKKNEALVKKFLSLGARLDFIGKDGIPILVLAVGTGNVPICKMLYKGGADINATDAMGMSALGYAKLFHNQEILDVFDQDKESTK